MLFYLLKVNLALIVFWGIYRFLFRNDTFFGLRRFTLIAILLLSFLYPLPDIKGWISEQPLLMEYVRYYSGIFQSGEEKQLAEISMTKVTFSPENGNTRSDNMNGKGLILPALWGIYGLGICVLLFRCLMEIQTVYSTRKKSRRKKIYGIDVWESPVIHEPYSFLKWIFIPANYPDRQILGEILIHELTHVRQRHSVDIILGQIASIVCWINPVAWLLKKEISINHEYLADREVMNAGFNKKEYQYHLIGLEHVPLAAANLYNYFSVLPLKRRISMLNKKRMHRIQTIKYLALIPMAAILLLTHNMDAMARVIPEQVDVIPVVPALNPVTLTPQPLPIPPDDNIYTLADEMPKYPGGDAELLKYLQDNLKYPVTAFEQRIQG